MTKIVFVFGFAFFAAPVFCRPYDEDENKEKCALEAQERSLLIPLSVKGAHVAAKAAVAAKVVAAAKSPVIKAAAVKAVSKLVAAAKSPVIKAAVVKAVSKLVAASKSPAIIVAAVKTAAKVVNTAKAVDGAKQNPKEVAKGIAPEVPKSVET